jgi:putative transposase
MARPLRLEFAGAVYHLTARGNGRAAIYRDDADRALFLRTLAATIERRRWLCHAFCLMTNHYHLLLETQGPTLSRGMRDLNGIYTQAFNRRHRRPGHVFQDRFKAILVERDSHLLELCRYVVLNPVRARMVRDAADWPWSSYAATAGLAEAPAWLTTA